MRLLGWPMVVALVPLFGLVLEAVLLRLRWLPYMQAGFPLHVELVPIPHAPEGQGTTASVRWEVGEDGVVRWWANQTGEGLTGLHGVVRCVRTRRGVGLLIRWSPPWSPLLAASGVALFGAVRGLPHVAIPVAALMVFGLIFVYYQGAIRAAAELRWSFLSSGDVEDPSS